MALAANRWFNQARRWLGYPCWSISTYLKLKVKNAVRYIGDYEEAVATARQNELPEWAKRSDVLLSLWMTARRTSPERPKPRPPDLPRAEETLAAIVAAGGDGRLLSFDIADRSACRDGIEADMKAHGVYYGVVLNAGIARDVAFPAMTEDEWDAVLGTNLDGFYNVLRPIVMPMVSARKGGRIVTLSSVSGLIGNRGQVNYSAAKAGIVGATKSLAIELAKRAITVNCVAPGVIATQMTAELPMDEVAKLIPMRRAGSPDEVAAVVAFLCSDEASYVTRQVISVNGGMI